MKNKILLLILLSLFTSSCYSYSYKSGPIEEIIGTYELKVIEKRKEDGSTYSYKDQIEAQAYFTVDINGYGYYVYKDNQTDWKISAVYSNFIKDEETSDYYKAIELSDGVSSKYDYETQVGCLDEPTMGFNRRTHSLSYTIHSREPNALSKHAVEYQYVSYSRISKVTDLSIINEKTSNNFKDDKLFELNNLSGLYTCCFGLSSIEEIVNPNYGKYDYYILDIDSYKDYKITAYYALSLDHIRRSEICPITIKEKNESSKFNIAILHACGVEFEVGNIYGQLGGYLVHNVWSEPDQDGTITQIYADSFTKYFGDATSVDELITELTK